MDNSGMEPSILARLLDIKMATSLALGEYNSCAALTGGTIQCWGANDRGQLGNGTFVSSSVPVFVSTGGSLQCWGANTYGQLGDGTITSGSSVPVSVSNITTATSIAVGAYHTCAALTSATIKCWGRGNFGQLGNGTKESSASLVSVYGITTASSVAAGRYHTCAMLVGGSIKCWGHNYGGRLGDGTQADRTSPVTVDSITTYILGRACFFLSYIWRLVRTASALSRLLICCSVL